ncbi:hypothetical protein pclt_cds_710 [Pandoravirus celtis]|uniref:Uncharacterized protein n=1 Tax=Pandoravirus celtis TaxID=2568002 RepID=A0A4D6EHU8_9VIRU|nr:hypothetical protein pclt_cds_710 [Pandoravirus celtis]
MLRVSSRSVMTVPTRDLRVARARATTLISAPRCRPNCGHILGKAGPGAAASAAQASRALYTYAQTAARDIGAATKRGACHTPLACTRALVCAIVRDDPDDLAAILLSRVVDPQLPAVPTYASAADAELARLLMSEGECTAVTSLAGDPVYFFEVPSATLPGGWTPLNMAVVFRSPRSIAVLKSFGARPTTTVEPLLAEVMRSADSPFVMVFQRKDGTLAPLPPRDVLPVAMLDRLLSAFGRTSPLANADTNPLTAVREDYVLQESIRNAIPDTRADEPVRFLARSVSAASRLGLAPLPSDLVNADQMRAMTDELAAQWADTYLRSWRAIIHVLLEAGYSPDERTYVFSAPGRHPNRHAQHARTGRGCQIPGRVGQSGRRETRRLQQRYRQCLAQRPRPGQTSQGDACGSRRPALHFGCLRCGLGWRARQGWPWTRFFSVYGGTSRPRPFGT